MYETLVKQEEKSFLITSNLYKEGNISANDLNIAEEKVTNVKLDLTEIESRTKLEYFKLIHSAGCLEKEFILNHKIRK